MENFSEVILLCVIIEFIELDLVWDGIFFRLCLKKRCIGNGAIRDVNFLSECVLLCVLENLCMVVEYLLSG